MLKWLLALPFAAFILFNAYVYGNIITYRAVAPHQSAFMSMRMSEFRDAGKAVALDYRWVPYQAVSTNLKKALIASEDAKFAEHGGFDWSGIQSAIKRNEKSGKVRAGGSTISQQLAKNLFLNDSRSYIRKAEEAAITAMLEAYGLPTTIPPELDRSQIRRYLQADKKSIGGRVFFVLPEALGRVVITDRIDPADLEAVLAAP